MPPGPLPPGPHPLPPGPLPPGPLPPRPLPPPPPPPYGYHPGYYPAPYYPDYRTGAWVAPAVGAAVGATIAIGSIVSALPDGCETIEFNGSAYAQCGGTWYEPQFDGNRTIYVVVGSPLPTPPPVMRPQ
ncbi:MAG: hypothetical protein HXX10_15075 [Rhodoplanes sp.]|uniref:DUF6515 family protein n=1 Tax=Rhodoplanes sp. TaxID=1968906 RepID=UPI0017BDB384|nr:DUF6515 family protein [Rhodoplanes sp.]NVO15350.1 hypothetical protein [Rhodoplanes sp.]